MVYEEKLLKQSESEGLRCEFRGWLKVLELRSGSRNGK
jgi:hypothetical protein